MPTESDWSSTSVDGEDEIKGWRERRTSWGNEKAAGWELRLDGVDGLVSAARSCFCCLGVTTGRTGSAGGAATQDVKNDVADDVGTTELELDRRGCFLRQLKRPEDEEEEDVDVSGCAVEL